MKILSIIAQKPHSTGSGVYLTELVKSWDKSGHQQAIVCGVTQSDTISLPTGIKTYPVYYDSDQMPFHICGMSDEMPYPSTMYSNMTTTMVNQYKNAFINQIKIVIDEFNPDVIICHHLYLLTAFVMEAFPNKNICAISHGSDLRQIEKNPLCRDFIIQQIQRVPQIIALNGYLKTEIERIYQCDRNKISIIGSGYNDKVFYHDIRIPKDPFGVLYAGKLSAAKGVYSLLKAIDKLSFPLDKLSFSFAGGAANSKVFTDLSKSVSKSKYKINLLGNITQKQLAIEMNKHGVFVLPSFFEGSPLVLAEAMACGAKVVCSDLPGIQHYYDKFVPNNGIIYVPVPRMKNIDEPIEDDLDKFEQNLALAITKAINTAEIGYRNLEKATWDGIAETYINVLSRVFFLSYLNTIY